MQNSTVALRLNFSNKSSFVLRFPARTQSPKTLWASGRTTQEKYDLKGKMTREQIRYILIVLGVLDIVSFLRTSEVVLYASDKLLNTLNLEMELWDKVFVIGIPMLNFTLALLLLASGLLLILRKKAGIIIYYFEVPLRLLFLNLTFWFVLRLPGLQVDSWTYKIVLALVVGLELLRLVFLIQTQRKYFSVGKTASP